MHMPTQMAQLAQTDHDRGGGRDPDRSQEAQTDPDGVLSPEKVPRAGLETSRIAHFSGQRSPSQEHCRDILVLVSSIYNALFPNI